MISFDISVFVFDYVDYTSAFVMRAFVTARNCPTRYCPARFVTACFCLRAFVGAVLSCALLSGHHFNVILGARKGQ